MDAALIRLERRSFEAFIFENGTHYYWGYPDINRKVGITHYITPTKDMENRTVIHKSGRTTGVTYGLIVKIDERVVIYNKSGRIVTLHPALLITKCPSPQFCYYNDPIAKRGDSGGVWYIDT